MKKVLFLAALVMTGLSAYSQEKAATAEEVALIVWDNESWDFGKVKQGTPVSHEFTFTNTSKIPVLISNVTASCGCTTPSWTKDPVPPGQKGTVKATYNAANPGAFDKTVTVVSNAGVGFIALKIKGEVTSTVVQ